MKRFDASIAAALMLLATFVGVQASRARTPAVHLEVSTTSFGSAPEHKILRNRLRPKRVALAPSIKIVASRTFDVVADSRRKLEQYSSGTYIGDVLAGHDSSVARWAERHGAPLRVWLQQSPAFAEWNPDNLAIVREAFGAWTEAGVPLTFAFVPDSIGADVHVMWVDRFSEQISGKTLWTHDDRWWIVDGDILLALHHRSGELLDASAIRAISLHEVGHLIGLDHTADTTSIMAPRVHVRDLSQADRATAQLVYSLPPGSIRQQPRLPVQRKR